MAFSVLIVDDYAPLRHMLVMAFTRAGAAVREAANGAGALAAFEAEAADLVLIDHNMPGMSGVALVEALRARSRDARLVVLSGSGSEGLADAARAAGADAVLMKPIAPQALMQAINAVMAPRAA